MPQKFLQPFGLFGNTLRRTQAGFVARPLWFDAMKMHPPPKLHNNSNVNVPDGFPEDRLYMKLLIKRPWLRYSSWVHQSGEKSVATRFAFDQHQLMKHKSMTEKQAFEECDRLYSKELQAFKAKLFVTREVMLDRRYIGDGIQNVLEGVVRAQGNHYDQRNRRLSELKQVHAYLKQRLAKGGVADRDTSQEVHNYNFPGTAGYDRLQKSLRRVTPDYQLYKRDLDLPPLKTLLKIVEGGAEIDRGILPESPSETYTWLEQIEAARVSGRDINL